jgi:hypothetical protein
MSALYTNHLVNEGVNNGHWASLENFYPGIVYATGILTAVTIAINAIIWSIHNKKQ